MKPNGVLYQFYLYEQSCGYYSLDDMNPLDKISHIPTFWFKIEKVNEGTYGHSFTKAKELGEKFYLGIWHLFSSLPS